jgi:5-methylcytosine-specific restriction endonuclease McrA
MQLLGNTSRQSVGEADNLPRLENPLPCDETVVSAEDRRRESRRKIHRAWVEKHKEHRREYMRKWCIRNKDYLAQTNLKWCRDHQELRRASRRKYYWKHRERCRQKNQEYYNKHKLEISEQSKAYAAANRDRIRQYMHRYHKEVYYPKNKVRIRQKTHDYLKNHPEIRAKAARNYKRNHPDRYSAHLRAVHVARKARMRGASISDKHVSQIIKKWHNERSFTCYYCHRRFDRKHLHIDHIIPVSKGGKHSSDNICRACSKCNLTKRDRPVSSIVSNGQTFLAL